MNQITLDTLPTEVFVLICSFLDANYVINVLSKVCQRFDDIIQQDYIWKSRIFFRFPKKYPLIQGEQFDWKKACIEREEQYELWSNSATKFKTYLINNAHYAAVDAIQFLKEGTLFASGSRDRSFKLWDVKKVDGCDEDFKSAELASVTDAHIGWIWSIIEGDGCFYTGSWDQTIKCWDLENVRTPKTTYSLDSPSLCLDFNNNILASGSYNRKVHLFDIRSDTRELACHNLHRQSILCLSLTDLFIITGSEDGNIIVFDRRAMKMVKKIKLPNFPLCLSYGQDQLWVGDKMGQIHLVDPRNGSFDVVQSYDTGHTGKITGICHGLGSIATCSMDKTIRILEPSDQPECIARLTMNDQIGRISTFGSALVCANSDSSIGLWLQKCDEDYVS